MAQDRQAAVGFDVVFKQELARIVARRKDATRKPKASKDDELAGLALSGGGIRSAAISMGSIQALRAVSVLDRFDYLSTVSGGGYTGACLSAAMSATGGRCYPFGDDYQDSPVVGHIRNFSSYLLPRNRSALKNWGEAAAIILRGLAANAVCVFAFLLGFVALTVVAYPTRASLADANFLPRAVAGLAGILSGSFEIQAGPNFDHLLRIPFATSLVLGVSLVAAVLVWAALKSIHRLDDLTDDGRSLLLNASFALLVVTCIAVFLDVQPVLIRAVMAAPTLLNSIDLKLGSILLAIATAISTLAGRLGQFLETSKRPRTWPTLLLRLGTHVLLFVGACIVPLLIWLTYVMTYVWVIGGDVSELSHLDLIPSTRFDVVLAGCAACAALTWFFQPNNYSLHWLYRDRLSRAFLVSQAGPTPDGDEPRAPHPLVDPDVEDLSDIRLSELQRSSGPYPLVNVAINLQGSMEANKRGRNADFFLFSPDYIGSELTGFVDTVTMEKLEPRLDVGSAMSISGAAASANMGSSTIRLLSPTLALLNIRLGYYLRNPQFVGAKDRWRSLRRTVSSRFYLFNEMFNRLDECSNTVYLTDGGHVENLGIYELLKRRCSTIVVIDAECDPEFGCGSLLRVERYARIDLGVRIVIPWEKIAKQSLATSAGIAEKHAKREHGPHCAIGRIFYPDGKSGLIAYVKSSLTGDEKDYILDYARRNEAFPHETTGDQFFSEEQFEMYRALGFHMVWGLFEKDRVAFVDDKQLGFSSEAAARSALKKALST